MGCRIVHLVSGLEIGGLERVALRLAARGRKEGADHSLLLFDKCFRSGALDFSPGQVPVHFIGREPGLDLKFAFRLAKYLAREETNLVHAHNATAIFYATLAVLIARRPIAIIGDFHTRPSHITFRTRLLTRWASGRLRQTIAKSDELNRWLLHEGWVARCITIPNGVDLDLFAPNGDTGGWRKKMEIPPEAILVGHVGRFDPIKRHRDLIAAARHLSSATPVYFAFAGHGPLFDQVKQEASGLPNIRFLSNVADVPGFLRSIDIFVICSLHEVCPLALLEAMASARPVIATNVGGISDILAAGGAEPAGILVTPCRPDMLAEQIQRFADDAALRAQLGTRARLRAEAFSLEREWSNYSALYRDYAGSTSSGPGA